MKKSLFKKFFFTFLSIMLTGFVLLSILVLGFSGSYWIKQHTNQLSQQAKTVVGQLENGSMLYHDDWLYQYVSQVSTVLCQSGESQILVADQTGTPQVVVGESIDFQRLPPKVMKSNGTYTGTLYGTLKEECLVVSRRYQLQNNNTGMVFALIPMDEMGSYLGELTRLLLGAVLVIALLLFVTAYGTAAALVRPLTQMSAAANCLARGDFSKRIKTNRTDEVGQLATAFNEMTLSLEAGEKMRRGFVTDVSHELKTPMTTIGGFVDGILDGTIPPQRQGEYLAIVSDEVKRLSRLVNTLLRLSRLESGEIVLQPIQMDLTKKAVDVSFMLEPTITQKSLSWQGLETLPALWVKGDEDLLHRVMYNLLDNAVKYTPCNGTVWLKGWQESKWIHFTVRNTGDGIPESQLPFIFDRFYKVDQSRGQDKNSLGLGLYLIKTIVTQHGGTITVRSAEGSYTEFEVVLPYESSI